MTDDEEESVKVYFFLLNDWPENLPNVQIFTRKFVEMHALINSIDVYSSSTSLNIHPCDHYER